jgi:hypothetical protein
MPQHQQRLAIARSVKGILQSGAGKWALKLQCLVSLVWCASLLLARFRG